LRDLKRKKERPLSASPGGPRSRGNYHSTKRKKKGKKNSATRIGEGLLGDNWGGSARSNPQRKKCNTCPKKKKKKKHQTLPSNSKGLILGGVSKLRPGGTKPRGRAKVKGKKIPEIAGELRKKIKGKGGGLKRPGDFRRGKGGGKNHKTSVNWEGKDRRRGLCLFAILGKKHPAKSKRLFGRWEST